MTADRPDPQPPFDGERFRPAPLGGRGHLVETERFARPVDLEQPAAAFLESLPDFMGVRNIRGLAAAIASAPRTLWGLG